MSEEKFVYTSCPGWGDHEYCAIKTIVKDGKIVRTEAVEYTGNQVGDGHICQKGLLACRQPYNPDRLKWPLKRVGERGEGKWERISWDQALDEIAEKLLQFREESGPESVAFWNLSASIPPSMGLGNLLPARFASLWGATDPISAIGVDNGPLYACQYMFNNPAICFYCDPKNFHYSDYIIIWGANPVENQMRVARNLVEAQSRGAKIVDIGLVFDGTAGMADWFIPVKGGSDPAVALAMANIIIENGWYDAPYLLEKTNMPFLLNKETGMLLKNPAGGFYVWDSAKNEPVMTEYKVKEISCDNIALEGEYIVDGIACETVFTGYKRHLAKYDPDRVSQISGVPVADLIKLTNEYAHADVAHIVGVLGLRYKNQGESYRAMYLLGILTGNIGKLGGGVTSEFMPASTAVGFNDTPLVHPDGINNGRIVNNLEWFKSVKTQDPHPTRALIKASGNPLHNYPNKGRWVKETLPYIDLVVDIDIWMTDTGEYADYVLPDCMPFEREDIVYAANYGHLVLQEPAIEPPHEQKDPSWLYYELAKRVGLGDYFYQTAGEWLRDRIEYSKDNPGFKGLDLSYERLKKEKMIRFDFEDETPFDPFRLYGDTFPTDSGRMECFCDALVEVDLGFCDFFGPVEAPMIEPNDKFPYLFFTGRQRFFMQSMYTDDPICRELSGGEPTIRMNPVDAAREGLIDGDKVEAYNDRGHVVAPLRLDEGVQPGMVHAWFGWRRKDYEVGTYSELLLEMGGEEATGELGRKWREDYEKEFPVGNFLTGSAQHVVGTFDTLWDCACAIRKYQG